MDFNLRCNSLDCRAALDHLAVVTTCRLGPYFPYTGPPFKHALTCHSNSHIFCTSCADNLLTKQATSSRHLGTVAPTCPACHTELKNPDDIVKSNLNPTDDYKTSVLSGLNPSLILEIAGRGISFWMYQTTQEIVYQEYVSKTLTDKFNTLSTQLDNVIHEANTEIKALRDKLQATALENETISRKNHELGEALREKSRKQLHIEQKYDQLKRQSLVSNIKAAATNSIDRALNIPQGSANGPPRLSDIAATAIAPIRQGQYGGGQMQFTERERLTMPSGSGSTERRESSVSDGNSESARRRGAMMPPRVPTHGRVGSAGTGAWNGGVARENPGMVVTIPRIYDTSANFDSYGWLNDAS
ncbi:hypothetical protein ABW20_dc0106846 [Dactylellina cionopaga]|nr:hypothetical protein ABW20_dc0106846 [Dactylellina cionopaga]